MTLPTFAKKDEIPKGFESMYEEVEGKWHPKESDDASDLKAALKEEREKREAAEKLTKKVAKDLKDLETKAKAEAAGATEDQLKQLRADVRTELETEYADKLKAAERVPILEAENRNLKLDGNVKKMAGDAGFLPTKLDDFWKLHGDEFDLTADGKPMVKGKPGADPKKHIESLKAVRPEWVQGSQAGGGGAAGMQKKPGETTTLALSPTERLAAAHAAGAKA
jgi:hypothetical protein